MTEQYEGIVNPPIDTLLEKVDSKYALVLFAAKRARQINAYYSQLHEGLFEYVGPLVDTKLNEKPLSISMREIEEDLLEATPMTEEQLAAEAQGDFAPFELQSPSETDFSEDAFSAEGVGLDAVSEIADSESADSTEAEPTVPASADGETAEDLQA